MSDKIRLGIGIPAYGGYVHAEHAQMFTELGAMLARSESRFELKMQGYVDIQPVDRARNFLLAHAMNAGCDWLFMIDADTFVKPDRSDESIDAGFAILRMISEADRAGATIVAAPVLKRIARPTDRQEFTVFAKADPTPERPSGCRPLTSLFEIVDGGPFGKAHAVGTACIAINLHKIGESMFAFTDVLSEDLEFCRQVRELGGKILVDTRVRTAHMTRSYPLYRPKGYTAE